MRVPNKAEVLTGVALFGVSAPVVHAEMPSDVTAFAEQCVESAAALPLESISANNTFASQARIVGRRGLLVTFNPLSLEQAIGDECTNNDTFSVDRFTNIRVTQNGAAIANLSNVLTSGEDDGLVERHTLKLKKNSRYKCGARINVQAISEAYASQYDDESADALAYTRSTRSLASFAVKC
jgi:hypothetical protein